MASIKQNPPGLTLPDFRNFGVMLRLLLGTNLMALAAALVQSTGTGDWLPRYIELAAWVEPLLLGDLLLLAALSPLLRRLPVLAGALLILCLCAATAAALLLLWQTLGLDDGTADRLWRAALLGALAAGILLFYFSLRTRAFSPALSEARLQALTARIRPHFLFNSLNAVLSLIRADPRRAETALEELADLFRALMRDHRDLLPLADEIALCRQYLNLEKLRLGERLNVEWEIEDVPVDMKVPPLLLQPLLENAVYHGIEPLASPGTLRIRFTRQGKTLCIEISNPCPQGDQGPAPTRDSASGNHMALANIRERLALYYDLEAQLDTQDKCREDGQREYHVRIVLPCRSPEA